MLKWSIGKSCITQSLTKMEVKMGENIGKQYEKKISCVITYTLINYLVEVLNGGRYLQYEHIGIYYYPVNAFSNSIFVWCGFMLYNGWFSFSFKFFPPSCANLSLLALVCVSQSPLVELVNMEPLFFLPLQQIFSVFCHMGSSYIIFLLHKTSLWKKFWKKLYSGSVLLNLILTEILREIWGNQVQV